MIEIETKECEGCISRLIPMHGDVARCANGDVNKVLPMVPRSRKALVACDEARRTGGPCGPIGAHWQDAYWL